MPGFRAVARRCELHLECQLFVVVLFSFLLIVIALWSSTQPLWSEVPGLAVEGGRLSCTEFKLLVHLGFVHKHLVDVI